MERAGPSTWRAHHQRDENSNRGSAQHSRGRGWQKGRGAESRGGQQTSRHFGFDTLEALLSQQPEKAVMTLIDHRDALIRYVTKDQLYPDVIVLLVEVLGVIVAGNFSEVIAHVLLTLIRNNLFTQIETFVMKLPLQDSVAKEQSTRFWNAPDKFFTNLSIALNAMIETVEATAMDVVPQLAKAIKYTLPKIETAHCLKFPAKVHETFNELLVTIDDFRTREENRRKRQRKSHVKDEEEQELEPPDDFHEIDVYPTLEEIKDGSKTFLRKNVVRGGYKSVHHYLDIHFRLLREDFVAPLRAGINEYLANPTAKLQSGIKVHKNAKFLTTVTTTRQMGFLMQVCKANSIRNVEHTRRFMYGSLVCLTSDNFQTMTFGKIIDSDVKYLKEGQVVIGFDMSMELSEKMSYLFVECGIYFEPYYHVLNALKNIKEDRFPLKEYLVDVCTITKTPRYLKEWNVRNDVPEYLNESQREAFVGALNKELCIIQGPPGTGKTFLALQIARLILQQKQIPNSDEHYPRNFIEYIDRTKTNGPMLVICYTNHALDQFLEGLLPVTDNIVRVGGQSRNDSMAKFHLKNTKHCDDFETGEAELRWKLQSDRAAMNDCEELLSLLNNFNYIISFSLLSENVPQLINSWFSSANDWQHLEWLLYRPQNESLQSEDKENSQMYEDENELSHISYYKMTSTYIYNGMNIYKETDKLSRDLTTNKDVILKQYLFKIQKDYVYVTKRLIEIRDLDNELPNININYDQPHKMTPDERWLAYAFWLRQSKRNSMEKYFESEKQYRQTNRELSDVYMMIDLHKMRRADVVGITTTGAARLHKTLQTLAPRVVIVEEAAEVLEAHIVTALSPRCEHLILIGDHKQLRPSTADFEMTTEYRLGVSLFERMVNNSLHCHTLHVQHRMRPEIANLVCPSIYPTLINHESVKEYVHIRGVISSLYFITHSHREEESNDKSKQNAYEAHFLILLARYLVLNNYAPESITILSAYSGQWFLMKHLKTKYEELNGVRLCVLDNYQGEENDIILLSLVRNNTENSNGFLELENRICVALSRAKLGMYIMGNIEQLCHKNKIWRQVHEVLQQKNAVGTSLTLRCVNHPETFTNIKEISDFEKVPEGGCLQRCNQILECGHECIQFCHSFSHDNYPCRQLCENVVCDWGHLCSKLCYESCQDCYLPKTCTLPCGHILDIPCHMMPEEFPCTMRVPATLPCKHITDKPCHKLEKLITCPHPCSIALKPCGHICPKTCHIYNDPHHRREENQCKVTSTIQSYGCTMPEGSQHMSITYCSRQKVPCQVILLKQLRCGHFNEVLCYQDVDKAFCRKRCMRKLKCGHPCRSICCVSAVCQPCETLVRTVIPECGHAINWECGRESPGKEDCKAKQCNSKLSCGHNCPLPCAYDCTNVKCTVLVLYTLKPSPCGHPLQVPCHKRDKSTFDNEMLSFCSAKCAKILKCGHDCMGTCASCLQGRIHVACEQNCKRTLICGHACLSRCGESCPPCSNSCDYQCEHQQCKRKCGMPCTPCKAECKRNCKHQKCKAKCGELCTVPPCMQPCSLKLLCGHDCIGYCGDDCPPFCGVCDRETIRKISFGKVNEDELDGRYVYLSRCNHLIEGTAMEKWLGSENSKELNMIVPTCPKCKTPLQLTRYKHLILEAHKTIRKLKDAWSGNPQEIYNIIKKMERSSYSSTSFYFRTAIKNVKIRDYDVYTRAHLEKLKMQFDLYKILRQIHQPVHFPPRSEHLKDLYQIKVEYYKLLKARLLSEIFICNQQQIDEFQMELMRFHRIVQLAAICKSNRDCKILPEYTQLIAISSNFQKYNIQWDLAVKEQLNNQLPDWKPTLMTAYPSFCEDFTVSKST